MRLDFRVYPHFYEDICIDEVDFKKKQDILNIHKNSIATVSHIRNQMKLSNLDFLVLHAQDESSIDGSPIVSNEDIYKLTSRNPDIFMGIASVDPNLQDSELVLDTAFNKYGLLALRLNLSRLNIPPEDDRIRKLINICEKNKKSVIFESGISFDKGYSATYANPSIYESLVREYPNVKFCFTRSGWPYIREIIMLMMKYKNVYADTGVLYFDSAKEFTEYLFYKEFNKTWVDRSLNHQIIFASENPRFEQIRMANSIDSLELHFSTKELIMGGNALDFLGVDNE